MRKGDTILLTSAYGKKRLLTNILTQSLGRSKFAIKASFVWEEKGRVVAAKTEGDNILRLNINVNFKEHLLLSDCRKAGELTVYYRAFYIESFVHLLESLDTNVPTAYFSGLVHMEAITAVADREEILCRSIENLALQRRMSLLDIYCTIQAMNRMLIAFPSHLDGATVKTCRLLLDALLDFSAVPEIVCLRSYTPAFSSLAALERMKKSIERNPRILQKYALLEAVNLTKSGEFLPVSLEAACMVSNNPLWVHLYIRFLANAGCGRLPESLKQQDKVQETVVFLKENYLSFFQRYQGSENDLMRNNLEAIKMLSRGINGIFGAYLPGEMGVLHYY